LVGSLLAGALASGCATAPADPDYPAGAPLPYHVGVYAHADWGGPPAGVSAPDAVGYDMPPQAVLADLARALEARGVFARVEPLAATSTEQALAEGRHLDFVLSARLAARRTFDEPEIHAGWATLEVFTWLFGGIPSWFVPTIQYPTDAEMSVETLDMNQPRVRGWLEAAAGEDGASEPAPTLDQEFTARSLTGDSSLYERADFTDDIEQYLWTIIVPPMLLVPGNAERCSASLTGEVNDDLWGQIARGLKARLIDDDRVKPLRVVFRPSPDDPSLVILDIYSEGGAPLRVMDLHRRQVGGTAQRYHWKADAAAIESANTALAGGTAGKARVEHAVPLVPGDNLITVRALRSDGVRVSRSWVIRNEGEE